VRSAVTVFSAERCWCACCLAGSPRLARRAVANRHQPWSWCRPGTARRAWRSSTAWRSTCRAATHRLPIRDLPVLLLWRAALRRPPRPPQEHRQGKCRRGSRLRRWMRTYRCTCSASACRGSGVLRRRARPNCSRAGTSREPTSTAETALRWPVVALGGDEQCALVAGVVNAERYVAWGLRLLLVGWPQRQVESAPTAGVAIGCKLQAARHTGQ